MIQSENIEKLAAALVAAQSEMGNAVKGSSNPFFKSKYADINAVREAVIPVLSKHGIAVIQPTVTCEGKNFVKTILIHESGQWLAGLTEILYKEKDNAQAQGSGITYARRYGLQSICNIGAEDDDGNTASVPAPNQVAKAPDAELPWLTEGQFSKALERIKNGEDLLPKVQAEYRIKRAYWEQLEAAKTK
jgi:hypothetical protein